MSSETIGIVSLKTYIPNIDMYYNRKIMKVMITDQNMK